MTDISSRSNTLNLFGGSEKDQLFRFQANNDSSTLQTAHELVLGAEKVKIVNADGASIDDVVSKFQQVDADILTEAFTARSAEGVLTTNLSAETTRASAAESALSASISAETTRATTSEGVLQSNIESEESRAMGIENGLRTDVNSSLARVGVIETRDFVPFSNMEIQGSHVIHQDGNNADHLTVKSQYHTDLEVTKSYQDSTSNVKIGRYSMTPVVGSVYSLGSAIKSYATSFVDAMTVSTSVMPSADGVVDLGSVSSKFKDLFVGSVTASSVSVNGEAVALGSSVDQEVADRITAVSAEADLRVAGDLAEATARTSAIAVETSARQSAVATEASTRASADTVLQNAIAVEKSRIDTLLDGTSIDLDQLKEIVDSFQTGDTTLLQQITTLSASLTQAQADIVANKALQDTLSASVDTLTSTADFPPPPTNFTEWTYVNSNSFTKLPAPYITHESQMTVTVPTVYFSISSGTIFVSFDNLTTVYRGSETHYQEGVNWPQLSAQF